jgi:cytochrome c oxidase subunit 2
MRRAGALLASSMLTACSGWQSALDPQGPVSASLARLIWLIVFVCGVIWVLVLVVLAWALLRRRSARPPLDLHTHIERRLGLSVSLATASTVLVVTVLTLVSFLASRGLTMGGAGELVIKLQGHQWWWEASYVDDDPSRTFVTANELHVPVGRTVRVELTSADVIHSFWVPSLAGKQDLIPGRVNEISFVAARAGVYRGQCAEFCGLQHAHMALLVVADEPPAFEAWRLSQLAPAAPPQGGEARAGRDVFLRKACAACHTVRGTPAAGRLGPDLTHLASRRTIAAGQLETTRGTIAAWVADPQRLKPGNNMPMVDLSADELRSVSAYLAELR